MNGKRMYREYAQRIYKDSDVLITKDNNGIINYKELVHWLIRTLPNK